MSILYNKIEEITTDFRNFMGNFTKLKTFLNFLPEFLYSMIQAESTTQSKIAVELHRDINPYIQFESHLRRINRFLNNYRYNVHALFDDIVDDVISRFKCAHDDKNIHISFDHMYVEDKYTILMFTLRIGKQGVPIYFEVFKGKQDEEHGEAFKSKNIKKGIKHCCDLILKYIPDANIVFLADRWFGNLFPIMEYIASLGCKFVIRAKQNIKVLYQPTYEKNKVWMDIKDLPHNVYKSHLYNDLEFTKKKYVFNLAYCKSKEHKEAWLLITNADPRLAKGYYGYRFGSIEFLFKSQKTNGFYLEETGIKNFHAFENLYAIICIANIYLTCLGTDISKNSKCYKDLGIRITRKNSDTNNTYRVMSRFKAGLTLFKIACNSTKYFRLPRTFTLYDA